MEKLTIKTGENSISFPINNIIYFYGWNYPLKYEVINTLSKHFSKTLDSEYEEENFKTTSIKINNDSLDHKVWNYDILNCNFSIENEFKLRAKSLMLQYFESCLEEIEYEEVVSTVNLLFEELNDLICEKIDFQNSNISINAKITNLTAKSIMKLLELELLKEELLANNHSLNYKEKMMFQIKMVKKIAQKNKLKRYIYIVDLPFIEEDIIKEIKEETISNLYFIIVNRCCSLQTIRQNVIYFGKYITPLHDDVELYNKIMLEYSTITTLEELDNEINNFLSKKDNKITNFFLKNL